MSSDKRNRKRGNFVVLSAAGLVTLVCLFGHLGAIGLVGPDEPRYAWIARAMATTGDWVTPRLYGQPWFEKPVLYYWLAGAGFLMHLPAEWAARLPSAIAALAAAVAIGWLGRKYYGVAAEPLASPWLTAPLIFSTSVAAIGFARAAGPDMLFSAALTLAMASAAAVLARRGALRSAESAALPGRAASDYPSLALFGAWLGCAALAKGPAGIVIAGGAIGIWALATKHWHGAFRLVHPIAMVAFCIVALPWYVLCAARNPDFIQIFIFQHNFERYLTPLFQHRQPFWYFVPILILGLVPWTAALWPAGEEGLRLWRERSWSDSPGFFFACWAIFPFSFFSFSQSKLPGYILPAIPPLALLIAVGLGRRVFARNASRSPESSAKWVMAAVGITWMLMTITAMHWINRVPSIAVFFSGTSILALMSAGILFGTIIAGLGVRRSRGTFWLSVLLVAALVELSGTFLLPALDLDTSARFHRNLFRDHRRSDRFFTFHLTRSWQYGLNFYFGREIPEWSPSDLDPALVLTTPRGLQEMIELGRVQGTVEQPYLHVVYVPVPPAPR